VHCQGEETIVDARIPAEIAARMRTLGHQVSISGEDPGVNAFGRVVAIGIDSKTRLLHGASGPPWASAAAGW
jgi:hypothetical protein